MKKKGFTLFELMVVVSIIMVLAGFGSVSIAKYMQNQKEKEISEGFRKKFEIVLMQSYNQKCRIDIKFNYNNNLILFEKEGKIIEQIKLPKGFVYSNTGTDIHFTEKGNVAPMFSFFVKDSGGKNFMKLTFSSVDKFVQMAHIRQYKYISNEWVEKE